MLDIFSLIASSTKNFTYRSHHVGKHIKITDSSTRLSLEYSCTALFRALLKKEGQTEEYRPRQPPPLLLNSYTLDGTIPLKDMYCEEEKQNGGVGYHWPKSMLEKMGRRHCECGQYKKPVCDEAISKYSHFIRNKTGFVFGTQIPWAESALLAAGAYITTVEYMSVTTDHERLHYIHPTNLTGFYLSKHKRRDAEAADFAWSFSSLEHDGLGRYGDPVNPFADLESMLRIRCLLKEGGIFFLGIPVGVDEIYWNAHRVYGFFRLALVLADWELLDILGLDNSHLFGSHLGDYNHQPIFVLRKNSSSMSDKRR